MLVDLQDIFSEAIKARPKPIMPKPTKTKARPKPIIPKPTKIKARPKPIIPKPTKIKARPKGKSGGIPPKKTNIDPFTKHVYYGPKGKIRTDPYTGYVYDTEPLAKRKGRPPKKRGQLNRSTFYQHVTRAIYNTGLSTGYAFHGTAEKSSQAIARSKLIQWGYARRKKVKGGIPDRRSITLTPKGVQRNRKHTSEPAGTKRQKARMYQYIYNKDPL